MKRVGSLFLALLIGILVPFVIWIAGGVAFYQSRKRKSFISKTLSDLVCAIDTDCPAGYKCLNGYCIPE